MTGAGRAAASILTRRRFLWAAGLALGGLAVAGATPLGVETARAAALHRYLGNYPQNRTTGWTENIQGVTHDSANWFFSQTKALWKFPVSFDLNSTVLGPIPARGILKVGMPAALDRLGYDHFGDIDCHAGYVFVPIEGGTYPGIAAFRASNLAYVAYSPLPAQQSAGWCAVNPANGLLHTSNWTLTTVLRYQIDFGRLSAGRSFLTQSSSLPLRDEYGATLSLPHVQGGVFRPDAQRLYLVNGYMDDTDRNKEGIQVFDMASCRRIARSTNGYGDFNYEYHPEDDEEPEGLTYWDLNDGRAPGIRGVLHVTMLDNDGWTSADDLYFKHYA